MNTAVRFRFGRTEIDRAGRRLWQDGRETHLSTKAFDLLVLLVERRPAVVSKSDIKQSLWNGTYVSDANLPTLIAEIRDALGDDARRGECIRTVHGLGYAFGADVVECETTGAAAVAWLVGSTSRITLTEGDNVLGREGEDVVELKSSTISRRHACVTVSGDAATISDLGSKNGTYLNERRVDAARIPVADGDVIRVGTLVFTIRFARPVTSTQTI